MKKKIYDIIPPQKQARKFISEKIISAEREKPTTESRGKVNIVETSRPEIIKKENFQKERRPLKRGTAILLIFIIIIAGGYWFFFGANKITVEIAPATELFAIEASVALSTSTSEFILPAELSQTAIPVESIEIEKEFNKEFPAEQVPVEEKAQGTIRVYNKSSRNISLVENTRFLSSSEPTRQFHATTKIAVPAGGYADIPVIASEVGEEYNIEPCIFSVPGLRNYSPPQLYYDIYGKSFSKMEGGRKETVAKITKGSLDIAQKELLTVARQQIISVLQGEAGEGYKIFGDSIELELIEGSPLNVQEGQEVDKFGYRINVKATALMAKTNNLLEFGKAYLIANIPSNKKSIDKSLDTIFLSESGGILTGLEAKLKVSAQIYPTIDEESLREIVKGRSKSEIARYATAICPELARQPKIIFNPFWARKASLNANQVKISIILE